MRVDVNGARLRFDVDLLARVPTRTELAEEAAAHVDFSRSASAYSARSQAVGEEEGEG
jgi:hypothetical protein